MQGTWTSVPLSVAMLGAEPRGTEGVARGGGARNRSGGAKAQTVGPREFGAFAAWARGKGFRAIQIDATADGMRARQLDRSARREIGAILRRNEVGCSGLDLWIPTAHFADPAKQDRAVSAVLEAIELAASLSVLAVSGVGTGGGGVGGRTVVPGVVCLRLPPVRGGAGGMGAVGLGGKEEVASDVIATIADRAMKHGVLIADHRWPPNALGTEGANAVSAAAPTAERDSPMGVGLDVAEVMGLGVDPLSAVMQVQGGGAGTLASVRLSEGGGGGAGGGASGGVRGGASRPRLDPRALAAILVTIGYEHHVVVDLTGAEDRDAAAEAAIEGWSEAMLPQ